MQDDRLILGNDDATRRRFVEMLDSFGFDCVVAVDLCRSDVVPGHDLRVVRVGIDRHAIRLEYRIMPPLPQEPVPDEPGRNRTPPVSWAWRASDDLGNEYAEAGGTYGLSDDGESTEGVFSLVPLPSPGATLLRVTLHATAKSGLETACSFDVPLSPTAS